MKKVIKVSISGIAFTLDEEANELLSSYLNKFENHYLNNPDGKEILEGIEGRMAELLSDRVGNGEIVDKHIAKNVIDIIGKPEEIFSEPDGSESTRKDNKTTKRLYRDPDNKMIAGVFGGIANYFNTDPTWLRLGFVGLTILSTILTCEKFNPVIWLFVYLILCICIPLAKTTEQKCEMRGVSSGYDGIQEEVNNKRNRQSSRGDSSAFMKCLGLVAGIILVIIALGGIITMACVLFSFVIAGVAIPQAIISFLGSIAGFPFWIGQLFKILSALIIFLPLIAMLYGGIMLIFNIKSPKWKPGLIMFLLWLISIIFAAGIAVRYTFNFRNNSYSYDTAVVDTNSNKLHIEFDDIDKWEGKQIFVKADRDEYKLVCLDISDKKNVKVALYPEIELNYRDTDSIRVKSQSVTFDNHLSIEDINNTKPSFCRISNDTIFLSPRIVGGTEKLKEAEMEVDIYLPDGVSVEVNKPITHTFNRHITYCNIDNPLLKLILDD